MAVHRLDLWGRQFVAGSVKIKSPFGTPFGSLEQGAMFCPPMCCGLPVYQVNVELLVDDVRETRKEIK